MQPPGTDVTGKGVTHDVSRVGTVTFTLYLVRFSRPAVFENAPPAFVLVDPALFPFARNATFAPETPRRFSSNLPLSSTEFVTVVRPFFVCRFVFTFALSETLAGMETMPWASIVPTTFGVAPLTVHGVITVRQT
jgi:hypothetical protein